MSASLLRLAFLLATVSSLSGCSDFSGNAISDGIGLQPSLPPPTTSLIPTVKIAPARGWPVTAAPLAAQGVAVQRFAHGLDHPRWLYVLPNGDVLVAETNAPDRPDDATGLRGWIMGQVMNRAGAKTVSANRITLLRDTDGDGVADVTSPFLENLVSPFGIVLVGGELYVANTDALVRYSYQAGQLKITAPGTRVLELPAGTINHHWTKNVIASADGSHLYVTVGSNSNVAENGLEAEQGRAAIWEVDRASGEHRIFASGLRNPNGMAWHPGTGALWTVVNERDELGNDLVPDYLTSVREGAFYGWPYSYYGQNIDTRVTPSRPDLVARAVHPDYALGSHVAALGLAWADRTALPSPFQRGMYVGLHGSWNRKPISGYKVVFVPFEGGGPVGEPVELLTGFVNPKGEAQGRPVGVAFDATGALLVADDVGNMVWRVSAAGATQAVRPREGPAFSGGGVLTPLPRP